jgi:hypothetical protein
MGGGGVGSTVQTAANGIDGAGFGAGGSGASAENSTNTGGDGTGGVIIITEYS